MDRTGSVRGWLPLVGWLGSLAAGIVLFTALGGGVLEAPPLTSPDQWGAWAAARDPFVAVVAILRLVVLALAWYLVGATTIGLVARLTRAARLVRIADALSVPMVRRLLQGALGLTLAAGVVASSSGAAPVARGAATSAALPTATAMVLVDDDADRDDGVRMTAFDADVDGGASMIALDTDEADDADAGAAAMRSLDEDPGGRSLGPPARMAALEDQDPSATMISLDSPTVQMVGLGGEGEGGPDEHEVVAGEHLWSIAADHLGAHLDHPPSDAEVAAHWERLIEANRDRLANPDDPDLIFPGQRFVLPDLPGGAGA